MGEFLFGVGLGWLPKEADTIARRYGAWLVNYTDPQCTCGLDCEPHECITSRRHWFAAANAGMPFNQKTRDKVLDAMEVAGFLRPSEPVSIRD